MDSQTPSSKPSLRPILIAGASFVAITLLLTLGIQAIGIERLRNAVESTGPLAPVAYVLIRALTNVIAPLNSGPLGFSAGIMFGLWQGALLSLIGEVLGCSVNFWIARKLGRPIVARFVGKGGVGRVEGIYQQVGKPMTLLYARLFLFAIYDLVSYAAGLTSISFRWFFIITLVGGIIPNVIAPAIGANLTGDLGQLVVMYAALAILCIVAFVVYRGLRRVLKLDRTLNTIQAASDDRSDATAIR